MLTQEKILELAKKKGKVVANDFAASFGVSRQYVNRFINKLISDNKLIKVGSARNTFYVLPEDAKKHKEFYVVQFKKSYKNSNLEEHKVIEEIEQAINLSRRLSENVYDIFTYAFSEMLNNAIEHSYSKRITIEVSVIEENNLSFSVKDSGIGVFKSVMDKKKLKSELDALGEVIKGKVTTMPKSHSGEGIFFTARVSDQFVLDSHGYQLIFNNKLPDIFVAQPKKKYQGTKVLFEISANSSHHLSDVFSEYANLSEDSDYGFDKTEIKVKLYSVAGVHVSRSQARRILSGLEKFRIIEFDYAKVPMIGQGFADEIYRVFHGKYPSIKIQEINMNDTVKFMVERAKTEAKRNLNK